MYIAFRGDKQHSPFFSLHATPLYSILALILFFVAFINCFLVLRFIIFQQLCGALFQSIHKSNFLNNSYLVMLYPSLQQRHTSPISAATTRRYSAKPSELLTNKCLWRRETNIFLIEL